MIDRDDTEKLLNALNHSKPKKMFEHFDKDNTGIFCVLHYLKEIGRPVSAGEISTHMKVSTARVAVLIKKLETKNYIEKMTDPDDARKAIITITDNGTEIIKNHHDNMLNLFSEVIDKVGIEKFKQFIELSEEIKNAIEEVITLQDYTWQI